MATRSNPTRIVEKVFADSATIKNQDFYLWNRAVQTGAGKTFTLPTPVAGLKGMEMWFTDAGTGTLTLGCTNGFLQDADSVVLQSKQEVKIECVYIGGTSYRWVVNPLPGTSGLTEDELAAINGAASPSALNVFATADDLAALATEAVQDTIGAMFTGNTETGIAIAYQDGDGTIDAAVAYGTAANTACQGNDARLPTTDEKAAMTAAAAPSALNAFATMNDVNTPQAEAVQDIVGAMFSGNTETGIAISYQDGDGTIDAVVAYGAAANTAVQGNDARVVTFHKTGLTGGTANDLDGIAYASCADLLRAQVTVGNNPAVIYEYVFDVDNGGAESSPTIIKPDDAAAENGRWVLSTVNGASIVYGTAAATACVGNDGRLPTSAQKTALFDYSATGLTGGGAGALDLIDGTALVDGDTALVIVGNNPGVAYIYVLDDNNAGGESSPDIIAPDANGGDKRWVLATANGSMGDYGTTAITACVGNDARIPTTAQKAALFDYSATSLTGGGAGALDAIDGAALVDGDTAIVLVGNNPGIQYVYVLDADNAGGESSPNIIAPDANGGNKRWVLTTSYGHMGSTDWAAWPAGPTWASIPAVDTNVHKYRKVGNECEIFIDVAGADGDGWTPSTVTDLPIAPVDWNGKIPLLGRQSVNAAASTDMLAYVDAETDLRIEFDGAAACTNAQAWRIQIWGRYPIAAA